MDEGESSQPPVKRQCSGKEVVGSPFKPGLAENKEKEVTLQTIAARLDQIESTQQLLLEQFEETMNILRSYVPTLERLSRQELRLSGREPRVNVDLPVIEIHEDTQAGRNEAGPSGIVVATAGTMGNVDLKEDPEKDDDDEEDDSDESLGYDWK